MGRMNCRNIVLAVAAVTSLGALGGCAKSFTDSIRAGDYQDVRETVTATNVNLPDKSGLTPIEIALASNNRSMVLLLLRNGADPNLCSDGISGLYVSVEDGREKSKYDKKKSKWRTSSAEHRDPYELTRKLLANGARFDACGKISEGRRSTLAMIFAVESEDDQLMREAVGEKTYDVHEKLLLAAELGSPELARLLIDQARVISPQLMRLAVKSGNAELVGILLRKGGSPKGLLGDCLKRLMGWQWTGDIEDLNAPGVGSRAWDQNLEIARLLLEYGEDPDTRVEYGDEGLYVLRPDEVPMAQAKSLRMLVEKSSSQIVSGVEGGSQQVVDESSRSTYKILLTDVPVLVMAARECSAKVVSLLLEFGANKEAEDVLGVTARIAAEHKGEWCSWVTELLDDSLKSPEGGAKEIPADPQISSHEPGQTANIPHDDKQSAAAENQFQPPVAALVNGRALMVACREAAGGAAMFADLKSLYQESELQATINGMDLAFTIEKSIVYPDYVHTLSKSAFGISEFVVSGDSGWLETKAGGKDMEAEALVEAKDELKTDIVGVFRNLDALQCEELEPAKIDGVLCRPVHLSGIGESFQIFFLNPDNTIFMIQSPGVSPTTGEAVTQKLYIDEYEDFDGYRLPKTIRVVHDDELFGILTVVEFGANAEIDPSLFRR